MFDTKKSLRNTISEYFADEQSLKSRLEIFEKYLARHKHLKVANKYYKRCMSEPVLDDRFVARLTGEKS
jgi:uncharacterized protein YbgA (DUF1722 family)